MGSGGSIVPASSEDLSLTFARAQEGRPYLKSYKSSSLQFSGGSGLFSGLQSAFSSSNMVDSFSGVDSQGNEFTVTADASKFDKNDSEFSGALKQFDAEYNRRLKEYNDSANAASLAESSAQLISARNRLAEVTSKTGVSPYTRTSISRPTITPITDSYSTLLGTDSFGT